MIKEPVIIIGLGEMGSVFARAILKLGYPVYPVSRDTNIDELAKKIPEPAMVLIAVGEKDLQASLQQLPTTWNNCIALLQNELLPRDWASYDFVDPTVISVWFEKKKGQDSKVLIPSPCFGPLASILVNALATLDIPAREVETAEELEQELLIKNVYILTTNISGLITKGNVEDLWNNHNELALTVANEVMDIQATLVGHELNRDKLITGFKAGIDGDLEHMCMGRSAPARLARAIELADASGLEVKKLREIQQQTS
jgi:ketopantoate reductase